MKAGENQFAFSCDNVGWVSDPTGVQKFSARAEITAIASGPPLTERTPADQINWQLLRDEYDAPRVVTKLDGKENAWEVLCRKGEKSVPFGVEIDVEQVQASDAAYNSPDALTLEGFDDAGFFGETPADPLAKPVYDAKGKSSARPAGRDADLGTQH